MDSIINYSLKSERIIIVRLLSKPKNLLLCQIYAPTAADSDEEIEKFYEEVEYAINETKKWDEIVIVMGDFNAKIGKGKQGEVVGPHGLGERNERGERLVEFCISNNLIVCNTWFERRENSKHTWSAPDGKTKNQIDYIMIHRRYRNSIKNAKARPGTDCGSDHNPVVINIKTTLKRLKKRKFSRRKWNVSKLDKGTMKEKYKVESERLIDTTNNGKNVDEVWSKLKECLIKAADAVCGKRKYTKKQSWITEEILDKMEERRMWKRNEEKYRSLSKTIKKMCRKAKNEYYNEICNEIESLDKAHNPKMFQKVKQLRPRKLQSAEGVKNKDGKVLFDETDILERWVEYIGELYSDERPVICYRYE